MPTRKGAIQQIIDDLMKSQEESQKRFREGQASRTGTDPNQPWHPIFNPDPKETAELCRHWDESYERRKFARVWEDAVGRVKAKQFTTRAALAAHYSQKRWWGERLVRFMVKHERLTAAELRECLPGRERR